MEDLDSLPNCPDCPKCVVYREQLAIVLKLLGLSVAVNGKTQGVLDNSLKRTEEMTKQTKEVTGKLNESTGVLEEFIDALSVAMLREAEAQGMH